MRLRSSFDLDADEHPVRYVLDKLTEGIYEPLFDWLTKDILDSETTLPAPKSVTLPESCHINTF